MLEGFRSWIFVLVLLLGGPYLMYSAVKDGSAAKRLKANGRETLAAVESVEWRKKHGSESGFRGHIVFKLEDGSLSRAEVALPQDQGQSIKDGKVEPVVKVLYLPNDPSVVRVAGLPDNAGEMKWVGAGMLAVGVVLLWWRLRNRGGSARPAAA